MTDRAFTFPGALLLLPFSAASLSPQHPHLPHPTRHETTEPDPEFSELLTLLQFRDRALGTLYFRYQSEPVGPLPPGAHAWRAHGWWAFRDTRLAACRALAIEGADTLWRWAVWNGSRQRQISGRADPSRRPFDPVCASALEVFDSPTAGPLSYDIAGPLGLFYWHEPWSDYLHRRASDVKVLGRANVADRDCVELIFDMTRVKTDDGIYSAPACVWFDDTNTLLAMRVQTYVDKTKFNAPLDGPTQYSVPTPLEGSDFVPLQLAFRGFRAARVA